ncbi:MAG: RHS repeat domain-containing protein [Burkholderiales bacterium]
MQNYAYEWDLAGNLLSRQDLGQNPQVRERFSYDGLNRLTQTTLNGAQTLAMSYSQDGNILSKSDVGNYSYNQSGPRPHGVTGIAGGPRGAMSFAYDANGNMSSRNGAAITWTSFNLPRQVAAGGDYARFTYGPGRARVKQDLKTGATTKTIHYVGPHFEVEIQGSVKRYRTNVFAYGHAVYSQVETTPNGMEAYYVLHDHQGSVDKLQRAVGTGSDTLAMSFDAWGKRRNANWTADPSDQRFGDSHWVERGYTGHEHLDNVKLIHMNGRLEDPVLGRMLSPDPIMAGLLNPQALNPYSYVANDPTSYLDPSGYFLGGLFRNMGRALQHVGSVIHRLVHRWGREIVAVVAAYYSAGAASSWAYTTQTSGIAMSGPAVLSADGIAASSTLTAAVSSSAVFGGMVGGAVAGAITSGSLKGAGMGALTGGAMGNVGAAYAGSYTAGRVLAEAAVSGASAEIQGGNFADGFLTSAGLSALSWSSLQMREAMIRQSRLNPQNASGESVGFRGDGFKLGGCRAPCNSSPLGGVQGRQGIFVKWPYEPGSFLDRLVETFGGPHDFLNSPLFYDQLGNSVGRPGIFGVINATNVFVATPFAAASVIPGYAYQVLD